MIPLFRKNRRIILKEEGEGAFLFDPQNGNLKYVNRSGKEMFLHLNEDRDAEQMADALLERYPDADRDRLKTDVATFLEQLKENGFITLADFNSHD